MIQFDNWYENHLETTFKRLFEFLRFKSISTDQQYDDEVIECSQWLIEWIKSIGFVVKVLNTPAHPVIYAELIHNPLAETVLLYHHYDVQPADPYELWYSDPFEPEIRDGEVYARGAQDNKGQCFYSLLAIEAYVELIKKKNLNIKLIIEGDEENGSTGLDAICHEYKDLFAANHLLIVDAGIPGKNQPGIILGTRGIATMEAKVSVASTDLHSGEHGGLVYNPIRALSQVIAQMKDSHGKITIPGFYDDVAPISQEERKLFSHDFNLEAYQDKFSIGALDIEEGYTPLESNVMRPTLEFNGICGGYTGKGFKTVLPKEASVKISCRLVPNQDPKKITKSIHDYFKMHLPKGFSLEFIEHGGGIASRSSPDAKIASICKKAYEDVFNASCQMCLIGGSIPIAAKLADVSEADMVFIGMGLMDDNIHAPNEHFGTDRIKQGFLTIARILQLLENNE